MANIKILEKKKTIIDEVVDKIENSNCFVAFNYHGLSVADTNELRKLLKESGSGFKIYKNTLVARALASKKIDLGMILDGPKAFAFGSDAIAPIKVLSDFAKTHKTLTLEVGIVDGSVVDAKKLKELSTIPSKEGLLTMLAGGLMEHVRNMSICLDLYSQDLENK